MIQGQFSRVANRRSAKTTKIAGARATAGGTRVGPAVAILGATLFAATVALIAGCADENDTTAEPVVEPRPASLAAKQQTPRDEQPLDGAEFRLQQKRDWWSHAREVLFADIELNPEQARELDAIIADQLHKRTLLQERDAELKAARKEGDPARIKTAREEFRALQEQIAKPHEIYEQMRAVLAEPQRPAFDMNRARHVAENQ